MAKDAVRNKRFLRITANHGFGVPGGTVLALVFSLFASVAAVWAGTSDDILGLWYSEEHDGLIEVFKCESKYCGRIVWSKAPNYPADDKKGRAGQPRKDDNNPDKNQRDRPIIGIQIMTGFVYSTEDQQWNQGTVYDPKNGKTYSGRITLVSPGKLHLKGYVFLPLFGRSTTWTRQAR